MKKIIISVCVILVFFVSCISMDTQKDEAGSSKADALSTEGLPNLLMNPGFEEGIGSWFAFGPCTINVSTDQAHTGANSLFVSERTNNWEGGGINVLPTLKKGSTYIIAVWVMVENSSSSFCKVTVKRKIDAGDNYDQVASQQVKGKEWVRIKGKYRLESTDSEFKELTLYIEGPDPGINYYLDDLEIVLIDSENSPENTSSKTPVAEPEVVKITQKSMINPGFEDGITGWTPFGTCDINLNTKQVHSGNNSVYVSSRTGSWNGVATNVTSLLQQGGSYTISGWVFLDNTSSATVYMSLMQTDSTGENFIRVNTREVASGKWVQLSGKYTVESSTITDLVLYFEGPDPEVNYYVDDVAVELLN